MGPLAGKPQVKEVSSSLELLKGGADVVFGGNGVEPVGAQSSRGAFFPITLLACNEPHSRLQPHEVEAFGPVNTVMPYSSVVGRDRPGATRSGEPLRLALHQR